MARRKGAINVTTTEHVSERKLQGLLKQARAVYKQQRTLSGELGQAIGNAVEHDHLHRKAFGVIRQLDRLEPEKLAEFLEAFNFYLDISGLNERAESAPKFTDNVVKLEEAAE